ncbi:NAD(P)-binding protein [Cryphonectria parasitica EP155]|uniref:NAD(P)-binding protein n=1 Tax=Cryphonectria parasitica (strain ATCC 38755 / EP155) TaxID=660469 RepID=A0A9P5CI34_CRYP1|nr:NAD(P)-binding protein [Cryphonectria parasitica EP155]KAF3760308.1 NAD(P)-binding protein [Cryphonectria parasitica EP155]
MSSMFHLDFTTPFHHHSYPAISPTRPELSATGKTIFISGGGRGIGTEIVKAFAQAGAAHIIVIGRTASDLTASVASTKAEFSSTRYSTIVGSVSSVQDMAQASAEVKKLSPAGIDVLIANAGYLHDVAPVSALSGDPSVDSASTADWWQAFEVNVKGIYLQARLFLTLARPGGVFVNVSAGAAHLIPAMGEFSGYAGSKIGAARVVEALQVENQGFNFFSLCPGVVRSEMLTKSGLEPLCEAGSLPVDDADLPAHFLVWLSSPEAGFLKGKFLWTNWDVDELKSREEKLLDAGQLVTGLIGWS